VEGNWNRPPTNFGLKVALSPRHPTNGWGLGGVPFSRKKTSMQQAGQCDNNN